MVAAGISKAGGSGLREGTPWAATRVRASAAGRARSGEGSAGAGVGARRHFGDDSAHLVANQVARQPGDRSNTGIVSGGGRDHAGDRQSVSVAERDRDAIPIDADHDERAFGPL